MVCQHHRQMAGMPLRKARENLLKVLTGDRITDHVTLIPAFPRSGQVDVLRRAVLDPPAPLCETHRVADHAQQVRQRVAAEAPVVHVVDELLDILRLDSSEAVLPEGRADVQLDALCVSGAGGFFAFDGDVVCQPRVKAVGVAHLRGRKHGPGLHILSIRLVASGDGFLLGGEAALLNDLFLAPDGRAVEAVLPVGLAGTAIGSAQVLVAVAV